MTRAWPENGGGGDMSGPPPGRRVAVYSCSSGRRAGGLGWLAWLAGFPGRADAGPGPRRRRPSCGPPHGLLIAGFEKLRKTHENGDSNFPKTVVKAGYRVKKIRLAAVGAPGLGAPFFAAAAAAVSI